MLEGERGRRQEVVRGGPEGAGEETTVTEDAGVDVVVEGKGDAAAVVVVGAEGDEGAEGVVEGVEDVLVVVEELAAAGEAAAAAEVDAAAGSEPVAAVAAATGVVVLLPLLHGITGRKEGRSRHDKEAAACNTPMHRRAP